MPNNYMICSRILHAHILYLFIWLKVTFLSLLANNYILNIVHYLGYQCLCIQCLSHCLIAYSDQNFALLLCMYIFIHTKCLKEGGNVPFNDTLSIFNFLGMSSDI